MNSNYQKGVRFERERLKAYEKLGYLCMRTAGSHGAFDLVAVSEKWNLVILIQCKTTNDLATANRLLKQFREHPPMKPLDHIHQCMEVKVTGSTEVHSVTV